MAHESWHEKHPSAAPLPPRREPPAWLCICNSTSSDLSPRPDCTIHGRLASKKDEDSEMGIIGKIIAALFLVPIAAAVLVGVFAVVIKFIQICWAWI